MRLPSYPGSKKSQEIFFRIPCGDHQEELEFKHEIVCLTMGNKNKKWKYIGPTTLPLESFPYVLLIQL
jgi:hypothetical protein